MFIFVPTAPIAAAEPPGPLSIVTSPLPISLITDPGKPISTELRVKNNGTVKERLKVDLMKFSAFGEDGRPRLTDREPADAHFDWVRFSTPTFDAEPNVWRTVTMTITPPKSAAFGYYYAAVFSRANPDESVAPKETSLRGGTATLVLLEVRSGAAKRSLEATAFSVERKFYEFLPATFNVKLRNQGNIHVLPHGTIFITQGKRDIDTVVVNSEQGNILPNSNRIYEAKWRDGFPVYVDREEDGKAVHDQKGNIVRQLKWDLTQVPKLRFGKYTAHLLMIYDDGKRDVPLEATVDFWVVPWRLLGAGLFIGIFVLIGLYSTGRKTIGKLSRRRK